MQIGQRLAYYIYNIFNMLGNMNRIYMANMGEREVRLSQLDLFRNKIYQGVKENVKRCAK